MQCQGKVYGQIMKSIRTYRSGIENLNMNMKVNQDDVNNLQWLNLTCGKGSNLAIAPPELAIMEEGCIGFHTTNDQDIF